jgi:hypothetical protein
LFTFSGKKAPNLVDFLDRAILSHWATKKQELFKVCIQEQVYVKGSNRKMAMERLKNDYKTQKLNLD